MRIEQLAYLLEVINSGSINAAGEKLHIAQQSLNATLKNMEKELGITVLNKTNRGIALTDDGLLVKAAAEDIVARMAQLEADLTQKKTTPSALSGTVKVYTTPGIMELFLPTVLNAYMAAYPLVKLIIEEREHTDVLLALEDGKADIGLFGIQRELIDRLAKPLILAANIQMTYLYDAHVYLAVHKSLPLAQQKSISMRTAAKQPFIIYSLGNLEDNRIYQWLNLYGKPDIAFTTSSLQVYVKTICSGNAIGTTICDKHSAIHNVSFGPDVVRVPIKPYGSSSIGYLYNTQFPITPPLQKLIDLLDNYHF